MTVFDGLAAEPRWVAWRNELRDGKPTKVPYSPRTGRRAKADDPATWGNRGAAEQRTSTLLNGKDSGGIGIVLGDLGADTWLAGVDLDSCIDEQGCLALWAKKILNALDSYAETSPSGRGLKAFFYCAAADVRAFLERIGVTNPDQWGIKRSIGENGGDHGPAVQIYFARRYFAVTENLWPGKPERVSLLDWPQLEQIAQLIPTTKKKKDKTGGDTSRSAEAFREGARLRREGKSFEEIFQALREHDDPAIRAWVREKGDADGGRQLPNIWNNVGRLPPPRCFEDDLALTFSDRHCDQLRFLAISGKWYLWQGERWRPEETLKTFDFARTVCRDAATVFKKSAPEILKAKTVAAVVSLARADRRHATTHDQWDADDWIFNTPAA